MKVADFIEQVGVEARTEVILRALATLSPVQQQQLLNNVTLAAQPPSKPETQSRAKS